MPPIPKQFKPLRNPRTFRLAAGLLARPALTAADQARLREMVNSPHWRPLPRLASINLLEPLFRHHAMQAGVDPALLMESRAESIALPAPSFIHLALVDFHRREALGQALAALHQAGVARMMLFKGAALAPVYPSPALRQMCDVDLVVNPEDGELISKVLRSMGARKRIHGKSEVWIHPSRLLFDFHAPDSPFTSRMFAQAEPHPSFVQIPGVVWPKPSHHLVILAIHAARNAGNRLWRDICDAQLLLSQPSPLPSLPVLPFLPGAGALAEEAMRESAEAGENISASLAALFQFMNQYAFAPIRLPECPASGWSPAAGELRGQILALYHILSVETASPVTLNLLRLSLRPPLQLAGQLADEFLNRLKRARSRQTGAGTGSPGEADARWGERDPALGDVPKQGSLARHWLKVRLLWRVVSSGSLPKYRKIAGLQNAVLHSSGKPFSPLVTENRSIE